MQKSLFYFASTLCNFYTHSKNIEVTVIAQKVDRVIRASINNFSFKFIVLFICAFVNFHHVSIL